MPGASGRPACAQAGPGAYGLDRFLADHAGERRGYHENDERVSVANLELGVGCFVRLVEELQ